MANIYKKFGGSGGSGVTSVNGQTGPVVVITKSDVGLGNVDNTSDINKPVSTATQDALDAISAAPITKYIQTFNDTTDWTLSGSFYIIIITEVTHERGTNPNVHMFELVGANYEEVNIDRVQMDASGNLELRVTLSARFPGKVVII